MSEPVVSFFVYLGARPLLWMALTLAVYLLAQSLARAAGNRTILNPVALSIAGVLAVLLLTDTSYEVYFEGAQFVHFLLGPATVAIAVPLYQNLEEVKRTLTPMMIALTAGALTAVLSVVAIAWAFGGSLQTIASLAPKSVTTPIAMGVSERIGGLPSLTAALVILTGIVGAMSAFPILDLVRCRDERARGFAMGVAAHGIGTARAFEKGEVAGTFSGIAMGLSGILTALIAPLVIGLIE